MLSLKDDDDEIQQVVMGDACLGHGSFGAVYLGFDGATGRTVAVKEIPIMVSSEHIGADAKLPENIRNEIAIMREARHPNLVAYFGSRTSDSPHHGLVVQIVMEFVAGGSIAALLRRAGTFREAIAAMYTRDLLSGLSFLHSIGVCHRDIKSENLLVSPEGRCKIADYGTSKSLIRDNSQTMMRTCVGTPHYMAPEVARGDEYGREADVWSAGCIVHEMLTGSAPTYGVQGNPMAIMYRVASDDEAVPTLPASFSPEARNFLELCCCRSPQHRPTAAEMLTHPWLAVTPQPESSRHPCANIRAAGENRRDSVTSNTGNTNGLFGSTNPDAELAASSPGLRKCQQCASEIALFGCDDCRSLRRPANLCSVCWVAVHSNSRMRPHAKRPMLFNGPDSHQVRDTSGPSAGLRSSDGIMLPGGTFVDTLDGGDYGDVEWECGVCHSLNAMSSHECVCGHTL
jgi:serine/threonine protein kinase